MLLGRASDSRVAKAADGASQDGIQATSTTPVSQPGANGGLGQAQDGAIQEDDVGQHGHEEEGRAGTRHQGQ